MEVILSSAAKAEVKAAAVYYDEKVDGLGRDFLKVLRGGLTHIKQHPSASIALNDKYRRHLLTRFPFGIIYRIEGDTIFVAAVMHLRREPYYWLR